PLYELWLLAFSRSLLAVNVVGFVVYNDNIPPPPQESADQCRRVLPCTPPHGAKHRLRNEPTILNGESIINNPVIAPRLEGNALPVSHKDVGLEFFAVLRR